MTIALPMQTQARAPRPSIDADWIIGGWAALAVLALALFDQRMLSDGDTAWHLAAGEWMLRHGQVPTVDLFSFTRLGAPWHAHEWLSEVAIAAAYRLDGWSGVVMLFGVAVGVAALLLTAELKRWFTGVGLVLAVALALACAAPNLLARPHVLVLPLLIAWTSLLLKARRDDQAPPLAAALLVLVWANMHGSYVFAFLLLGVFGLEALVEAQPVRRWPVLRDWGLFAALCVAGSAVTPQGVPGLIFPFQLMSMSSLAWIQEWAPMDFAKIGPFELSLAATLFICLSKGVKVPPLRLLLLLGLLHMALQHARHGVVVAMVAALVLAPAIVEAIAAGEPAPRPARPLAWLIPLALVLALFGARAAVALQRTDTPSMPISALEHVPASLRAKPVLNEYGFGGYLILRGVKPFIDGRTDLYGDAFMARYAKLAAGDRATLDQTLKQYAIAWTILPPDHPLVPVMDALPGWRRLYADKFAVVDVRATALPQPAGANGASSAR